MLVAVDPGFGNLKLAGPAGEVVLPSLVALPAGELGQAGVGVAAGRRPQMVAFDGLRYVAGERAEDWGRLVDNLSFDRFLAPEGRALLYAGLARLLGPEPAEPLVLAVGLPVPYLRAATPQELRELRGRLLGEHRAVVDGRPARWEVARVAFAAQPLGAWAGWALREDGRWARPEARETVVAVVDVGMHTVDLYGLRGTALVPALVGGSRGGVHRLLALAAPELPPALAAARLRRGALAVPPQARAAWASEVVGTVQRQWDGERPGVVILAGGGAALLLPELPRLRRGVGVDLEVAEEPVLANVRGLLRWARSAGLAEADGA